MAKNQKSMAKNQDNEDVFLEDIVTSLQKSFSRVTERSESNVGRTAQIVGDVNFEITTKLNPIGDKLVYTNAGGIEVTVSGSLDTDIKEEDEDGND